MKMDKRSKSEHGKRMIRFRKQKAQERCTCADGVGEDALKAVDKLKCDGGHCYDTYPQPHSYQPSVGVIAPACPNGICPGDSKPPYAPTRSSVAYSPADATTSNAVSASKLTSTHSHHSAMFSLLLKLVTCINTDEARALETKFQNCVKQITNLYSQMHSNNKDGLNKRTGTTSRNTQLNDLLQYRFSVSRILSYIF